MVKTVAEWFEEGIRCFNKPDGPNAIAAFENVIDKEPAYRHPDGDNPYFYLGKICAYCNEQERKREHDPTVVKRPFTQSLKAFTQKLNISFSLMIRVSFMNRVSLMSRCCHSQSPFVRPGKVAV